MSRREVDMRMRGSYELSRDGRDDIDYDEVYVPSCQLPRGEEVPFVRSSRRSVSPQRRIEGGRRSSMGTEEVQVRSSRRSLSPQHAIEGARRTGIGRDRRSVLIERRGEHELSTDRVHVDRVRSHGDQVLSMSPPIERAPKRVSVDDRGFDMSQIHMERRRKVEYPEYLDHSDVSGRSRRSYRYDEEVEFENRYLEEYRMRRSGAGGRDVQVDSIPIEDAMDRHTQAPPDYNYITKYGEASTYEKRYSEATENFSEMEVRRANDENLRYQDAIPHEKLVYYKEGEKYGFYSRDGTYINSPVSQIREFRNEGLPKDSRSASTGMNYEDKLSSKVRLYQDAPTSPSDFDGYSKRYGKAVERPTGDDYVRRTVSGTRKGYESECRDPKCYDCNAYNSGRYNDEDCYRDTRLIRNDDPAYASQGNLYSKMPSVGREHDRVGREHDHRLKPDYLEHTAGSLSNFEGSHSSRRIIKNNEARETGVMQKGMSPMYIDSRRSSDSIYQNEDNLYTEYPHKELPRKILNHHHGEGERGLHSREFEESHLGHTYGRHTVDGFDIIRSNISPQIKHDVESLRPSGRSERMMVDELLSHERLLKRKYGVGEVMDKVDSRSLMSSKLYAPARRPDIRDCDVERTGRKVNSAYSKRSSGYEGNDYDTEAEQMFDQTYGHKESTNTGWNSHNDQLERVQEHSRKPFRTEFRQFKGYSNSESSNSHGHVHHSHQRNHHNKQHNFRTRNENNNGMDAPAQASDLSVHSGSLWKSEPAEDTDVFKQNVHAAFLDFSKRFNENPIARKLYKEDGKAGSLFCVVCRRSVSKDFQDTRALATHAFMSHKVGLRSLHLGLHKAICVLMGWNILPDDSGTWAPEALPQAEALAQKEDIVLWPPVVIIHNISLSSNDHNEWKLIKVEALGDFLRDKGYHLGKMRICLGNPGDHSVILVKFLGTLSGLQEAERLHRYFLERKHGRVGFEEALSSNGESSKSIQGNESEKLEDVLLYGYMGLSEDLDRVDYDTKKRCSVRSKKEIHEFAEGPIKPEEA